MATPLIAVEGLTKHFPVKGGGLLRRTTGYVHAVDDATFEIQPGETLGLVGESGSGKSTIGRLVLRLLEPTAGRIVYDGADLASLGKAELRALRREAQIVFQDPFASLNPRMTVRDLIGFNLYVHGVKNPEKGRRVKELLALVGLDPGHANRYPHEFSGGQRQRIGLARALALKPRFIVADEPVSALDVSIQAQMLNLFQQLKRDLNLTYLFISHNLSVVEYVSDRVAVMYLGRIVELTDSRRLYREPLHPYTIALMSAIPKPSIESKYQRIILQGEIPSSIRPPSGCRFRTRCPIAGERCAEEVPPLAATSSGHLVACHLVGTPPHQALARQLYEELADRPPPSVDTIAAATPVPQDKAS